MIPGIVIEMGGRDWTVPPLTLAQLRQLMPKVRQLSTIGSEMGEEQIDILVEIVAAAVQRNYPDTAPESVAQLLDLGNAGAVLNAVLTSSGVRANRPGEEEAARADGPSFTASSPPASATASPISTP